MSMPTITLPEHPISIEQAKADIIESIALEETALAHVINAEGEKIQKALTICPATIDHLVILDEVVDAILKDVIKMQMLLQFKLENALKIK